MNDDRDHEFFHLRKQGKTYLTKAFRWRGNTEKHRFVRMVFEGSDEQVLGEIDGALCLRISSQRKNQITALVSQDTKGIKRLSFQSYRKTKDGYLGSEKNEFTFLANEWERLKSFLKQIEFVDLSNEDSFQIEDISTQKGKKALIDASDAGLITVIKSLTGEQRNDLLSSLKGSLSSDEINTLLGRKQGLEEFERQLELDIWNEAAWQDFFAREQWVFGYGLDYRIMGIFDREMVVGGGGTDNRGKPTVDFLAEFTNYTVLVEIKTPGAPIFKRRAGGRAGTWDFSAEFMSAVSQILEQKAEWLATSQSGEHFSKDGSKRLQARTRSPRAILVIGSRGEFDTAGEPRDARIRLDTFELFRRENRSIDIITYDELIERARFITRNDIAGRPSPPEENIPF